MRYLDANVFVFAAVSSDPEGEAARVILRETASGKQPAITSALAIDEVVWAIRRVQDRPTAIRAATRLTAFPHLTVLDVKAKHMVAALDLMERYETLRPRDAVHAAVAIDAGVFSLVSTDPDFDAVREITRVPLARP